MSNKYEHYKEKKIYFYRNETDNKHIVFDGSEFYTMTEEKKREILNKPFGHNFILVRTNAKNDEDMKTEYKQYISDIEEIKSITDNKINMYKTGTIGNTALSLFTSFNNIEAERVEEFEYPFLNNGGGVRFARKDYEGIAYKYDINSFYPSMMLSRYIRIPLKPGRLINIKTDELEQKRCTKYGVYNVIIECDDPAMFSTNDKNLYSHFEVNYAKKLNLKITVIGQCIVWDKEDTASFYDVFNKYINYLYPQKKKHKQIKFIMNSLWGVLCSSRGGDNVKYIMNYSDIKFNGEHKIKKITPLDDTYTKCEVLISRDIKFYRTNYARMKPFLLGFGRITMHKIFNKIGYDNVVWSHTDSVVCSKQLSREIRITGKIGDWKYEGKTKNCYVYNKNFIDGF